MALSGEIEYVAVKDLTTPQEGYTVYLNRYWAYDPLSDCVVFYKPNGSYSGIPQCNKNREIALDIAQRLYNYNVRYISIAFVYEDPRDYT